MAPVGHHSHVWHAFGMRFACLCVLVSVLRVACSLLPAPQGTSTYVVNSQRIIDLIMWVGVLGAWEGRAGRRRRGGHIPHFRRPGGMGGEGGV